MSWNIFKVLNVYEHFFNQCKCEQNNHSDSMMKILTKDATDFNVMVHF